MMIPDYKYPVGIFIAYICDIGTIIKYSPD